jgi:chromosome segregation ATPase
MSAANEMVNADYKMLDKLTVKKDKLKDKIKKKEYTIDFFEKCKNHLERLNEKIGELNADDPDFKKLKKQRKQFRGKLKQYDSKKSVLNLKQKRKEKKNIDKSIKELVAKNRNKQKTLQKENSIIKGKIKRYDKLKNHEKRLNNKINQLEDKKEKSKSKKNIVDTDKDGVNDKRELRASDGELRTNPDKDDITKLEKEDKRLTKEINKLKSQRKKIRKEIRKIKINKLKDKSKKIAARSALIGKFLTKGKRQVMELAGNEELERTARVIS